MSKEQTSQNMNWKGFCAHLLRSTIWPAVAVVFLFNFRGVIEDKIRQADEIKIAGVLSVACSVIDQIVEDQETLNTLLTEGINSKDDFNKLNKISSSSQLYASLISKAGLGEEAVAISRENYEESQRILKGISSIKELEDIKEDVNTLREIGVKPEKIDLEKIEAEITKALNSPQTSDHLKKRLNNLDRKRVANLRDKMESLKKPRIDTEDIEFIKIKPEVLREIDSRTIRMSVRK